MLSYIPLILQCLSILTGLICVQSGGSHCPQPLQGDWKTLDKFPDVITVKTKKFSLAMLQKVVDFQAACVAKELFDSTVVRLKVAVCDELYRGDPVVYLMYKSGAGDFAYSYSNCRVPSEDAAGTFQGKLNSTFHRNLTGFKDELELQKNFTQDAKEPVQSEPQVGSSTAEEDTDKNDTEKPNFAPATTNEAAVEANNVPDGSPSNVKDNDCRRGKRSEDKTRSLSRDEARKAKNGESTRSTERPGGPEKLTAGRRSKSVPTSMGSTSSQQQNLQRQQTLAKARLKAVVESCRTPSSILTFPKP